MENNNSCCGCGSNCCDANSEKKRITIDFLYLDLSVCNRCQGAETNLEEAVDEVSRVLESAGYEIIINKVNITTKELALQYQFISSPTIRINGTDIAIDVQESNCKDCGDLCGEEVECRVWVYNGVEYTKPPKEFIINAILKEVYSEKKEYPNEEDYKIPENLERFFNAIENK